MTATNRDFIAELDAAIGCQQCEGPLGDSPSDDFCSSRCQTAWSTARTAPLASYSEPDDQPAHVANLVELHSSETCVACVEGRHHGRRALPGSLAALLFASGARSRRNPAPQGDIEFGYVPGRQVTERASWSRGQLARLSGLVSSQIYTAPPGEPPAPDSPNWRELGTACEPISFGFDPATDGGGSMVAVTRRDRVDYVEAIISPGGVLFPPHLVEQMRTVAEEVGQAWADAWRDIGEALVPLGEQLERAGLIEEQPPDDRRERALWLRQHRNTGPAVSARAPRSINPRRGR